MKISLAGETLAISAAQGNHGVGRTLTIVRTVTDKLCLRLELAEKSFLLE
jgi:hypothetical protein